MTKISFFNEILEREMITIKMPKFSSFSSPLQLSVYSTKTLKARIIDNHRNDPVLIINEIHEREMS